MRQPPTDQTRNCRDYNLEICKLRELAILRMNFQVRRLLICYAASMYLVVAWIHPQRTLLNHGRILRMTTASSFPSSEEKQHLITSIAVQAAKEAGILMLEGIKSANLGIESKIGSRDIVTKVDKEVQAAIQSIILKAFPHHKFLGEEDIAPGMDASSEATKVFESAENLWIVDPSNIIVRQIVYSL